MKHRLPVWCVTGLAFSAACWLAVSPSPVSPRSNSPSADSPLADDTSLAMPQVGEHWLRVLSPTVLELTLITTQAEDGRGAAWNWVNEQGHL
jgi:hypothetical protein